VAILLFVLIALSSFMPWTQYRFRAHSDGSKLDAETENKETVAAVDLLARDPSGCPVIVAAEGGGIHSGAWATHVLRLLENDYRENRSALTPESGDSFSKHIVCVSGVSGGSYGLMYWVDSYGRTGGPADPGYDPAITQRLTEDRAMRSSLAAAVRGLVYHDLWQTLLPFIPWQAGLDRGSLMEREWIKPPVDLAYPDPLKTRTMRDWRKDTKEGLRPAVLFNSMNADNGQPVVFASTVLGPLGRKPYWEYRRQRPGEDVPVVTAVRCSASFPLVCPAASPSTDRLGSMHLVDGGYFDNYGMASLNRWLASAVEIYEKEKEEQDAAKKAGTEKALAHPPPKCLLVVQVRASSESLFPQILLPEWKGKGHTGTLYQATAPVTGLINMRGAAQTWHNDQEYEGVVKRLAALGITVRTATFRFPGMENPLSWHLTEGQQEAIRKVTFAAPEGNPPNQQDLTTAPKDDAGMKQWLDWTRHAAQWALRTSWQQVFEHFGGKPGTGKDGH
jgi:hypothetical protein